MSRWLAVECELVGVPATAALRQDRSNRSTCRPSCHGFDSVPNLARRRTTVPRTGNRRRKRQLTSLTGLALLPDCAEQSDELFASKAFPAGSADENMDLPDDLTALGGSGNRYASPTTELKKTLAAKDAERPEHSVHIDLQYGREVLRWGEALSWPGFALGERTADLSGDLIMERERISPVDLDL